jgi:hypothetical protein
MKGFQAKEGLKAWVTPWYGVLWWRHFCLHKVRRTLDVSHERLMYVSRSPKLKEYRAEEGLYSINRLRQNTDLGKMSNAR